MKNNYQQKSTNNLIAAIQQKVPAAGVSPLDVKEAKQENVAVVVDNSNDKKVKGKRTSLEKVLKKHPKLSLQTLLTKLEKKKNSLDSLLVTTTGSTTTLHLE